MHATASWGGCCSHLPNPRAPTSHCSLGALPSLPPATPAPMTPNESLRLVEGSVSPSTCNASHNDPQRVITTCWGLSLPLHLRCQPHRPPSLFGLTTTAVQTMSHVGSSLLPLPWVTHNDDGKPRRLVVVCLPLSAPTTTTTSHVGLSSLRLPLSAPMMTTTSLHGLSSLPLSLIKYKYIYIYFYIQIS